MTQFPELKLQLSSLVFPQIGDSSCSGVFLLFVCLIFFFPVWVFRLFLVWFGLAWLIWFLLKFKLFNNPPPIWEMTF